MIEYTKPQAGDIVELKSSIEETKRLIAAGRPPLLSPDLGEGVQIVESTVPNMPEYVWLKDWASAVKVSDLVLIERVKK